MALKDSVLNIVITAKDLAKGTLDRFRKGLKDTEDQGQRTENRMATLAKRVVGLVAAYASFSTITRAVQAVLGTGDKFEKLSIQMTAVMGSLEAGEQATEWIKEFTRATPLQLEDTITAFTRLKNFGIDPMNGSMQAIADQTAKLGGSQEVLIGITNALGQAYAKQKLQGEEILQLVERGVPVWDLLAEATGKSAAELNEMSSAGELGRDVIDKLIQAMGASATGAAAANMGTLSGIVSNLKDRFQEFLNTIAESGTLDYFKSELDKLANTITRMAQDGTLQRWAESISAAIVSGAQSLKTFATAVYDASGTLLLLAKAWAALKIAGWAGQITSAGAAMGGSLAAGAGLAARALTGVALAARSILWIGLIDAVAKTVAAFGDLKRARDDLERSGTNLAGVMEEEARRIAEFNEQTGLAVTSLDEMIRLQDEGLAVFDKANAQWIIGAEAVAAYQVAQRAAAKATEDTAGVLETEMKSAVSEVVRKFTELEEKAKRSEDAITDLLGDYDLRATGDVQALVGALIELEGQGRITASELQTGLSEALQSLTVDEIAAFSDSLKFMFDTGSISAQEYAGLLQGPVAAAMKKLGLDATLLKTGISSVGTEAIDSFNLLARTLEESGETAEQTGKTISAAYLAAFDKIKTEAGRTELLAALNEQLRQGLITAFEYNKTLDATGQTAEADTEKVRALREEIQRLREEMQQGGEDGEQMGDGIEEGTRDASAGVAILSAALDAYTQQMAGLSDGALAAWESVALGMRPAAEETDLLTARINTLSEGLVELERQSFRVADSTGLQRGLRDMKIAANEVEIAFIEQTQAARGLVDQYNQGTLAADAYISRANSMVNFGNLLNDQDLGALTAGIEAAEQAMASLRDQTADTLGDLQNELDRLEGRTDAIREREYQERLNDLRAQLQTAKATGDKEAITNATESLRIAERIYAVEKANRDEAELARKKKAAEDAKQAAKPEKTQRAQPAEQRQDTQNKTIRLVVGDRTAEVSTGNPSELLDLLAAAGLRTG